MSRKIPNVSTFTRARRRAVRFATRRRDEKATGGHLHSRYDRLQPVPEHPPDWQTGPPDFVIIGAQKSGTTWWHGLMETHVQIHRPPRGKRELHFFDHFWDRWPNQKQFERYRRYFPRPTGSLAGEKTPGYLYQPWVAPMLKEVAPQVKLIVLMRDPVARFVSGVGLLERSGSLKGEVGGGLVGTREHRIVEAIDRGRYADQLEWWLTHFPREQFLLLQYEQCVADPQGQLNRTFEFLGLRPQHVTPAQISRARKKATSQVEVSVETRRMLATRYAADVTRLQELMPDLDVSLWKSLARPES